MNAETDWIRLSSRFSDFERTVFPAVWFLLCAIFTMAALLDGSFIGLAGIVPAAAGYLVFQFISWKYVDVWATPDCLVVKSKGKEYRVPYTHVVDAKMHWYFHFAEIVLSTPYELGPVIVFLPYVFVGVPYLSRHPGNDLVLERARIARECEQRSTA